MGARNLFIGLDGVGSDLIEKAIKTGNAPNLAKIDALKKRIPLQSELGFGDGPFWTSAACGVDTSFHGVYYIKQFNPQTYEFDWVDETNDAHAPAFWDTLDNAGQKIFVLDWPRAPLAELTNGVYIENWRQHDPAAKPKSSPPEKASKYKARYGDDPFLPGMHFHPIESLEKAEWLLSNSKKRIDDKASVCTNELDENNWDVFAVVFSEAHDVGHNAYHIADENHQKFNRAIFEKIGDPLDFVIKETDDAIGRIVSAAGENCNVILSAGLGMRPLVSASTAIEQITHRLEFGATIEQQSVDAARASYRSFVPLHLRNALSPLKRFVFREKNIPALARRRFFPLLHVDNIACIRINLKGREKYGVVSPGAEYDALLDEIADGFQEIVAVETGGAVVEKVVRARDIYDGPRAMYLPDLFVFWNRDKPFTHIESPRIGTIELPHRPVRTGDHLDIGDLWADEQLLRRLDLSNSCDPKHVGQLISAAALHA